MAVFLENMLEDIPRDVKDAVDRARKRMQSTIRDGLRNQTGLLLNRPPALESENRKGQKSVAVPILLKPGLTRTLRRVTIDADPAIIQISPFRSALERAQKGLKSSKKLMQWLQMKDRSGLLGEVDLESPDNAAELIARLLALLDKHDPVTKILAIDEDILGVYRYRSGRDSHDPGLFEPQRDPFDGQVELYWAVIGLVARMIGVQTEALTGVVLIHELGHGYTHMGADIDNDRWTSWHFADTDHALKEGLAQYYTAILAQRLDDRFPGTQNAYEELLKRQPSSYHTHIPWLKEFKQEEVRLALIAIRKRGKATIDDFDRELCRAKKSLGGKNSIDQDK